MVAGMTRRTRTRSRHHGREERLMNVMYCMYKSGGDENGCDGD